MITLSELKSPPGWPRTHRRESGSRFNEWTLPGAVQGLVIQLALLGAKGIVLTLNSASPQRDDDPGVAVYFTLNDEPHVMACDRFSRQEINVRSLSLAIEGLRMCKRHGGDRMARRAFEGFRALPPANTPPPRTHWEVLGLRPGATRVDINRAYRTRAQTAHPDHGGSSAAMAELNAARDAALNQAAR